MGVTTHISTDVAAVPLLWVVPLALYLLTFIDAFAARPLVPRRWSARLAPVAIVAALVGAGRRPAWPIGLALHLSLRALGAGVPPRTGRTASGRRAPDRLLPAGRGRRRRSAASFNALVAPQSLHRARRVSADAGRGRRAASGARRAAARGPSRSAARRPARRLPVLAASWTLGLMRAVARRQPLGFWLDVAVVLLATIRRPAFAVGPRRRGAGSSPRRALPTAGSHAAAARSFFGVHRVLATAAARCTCCPRQHVPRPAADRPRAASRPACSTTIRKARSGSSSVGVQAAPPKSRWSASARARPAPTRPRATTGRSSKSTRSSTASLARDPRWFTYIFHDVPVEMRTCDGRRPPLASPPRHDAEVRQVLVLDAYSWTRSPCTSSRASSWRWRWPGSSRAATSSSTSRTATWIWGRCWRPPPPVSGCRPSSSATAAANADALSSRWVVLGRAEALAAAGRRPALASAGGGRAHVDRRLQQHPRRGGAGSRRRPRPPARPEKRSGRPAGTRRTAALSFASR